MQCEKCGRITDLIKHIRIDKNYLPDITRTVFYFNKDKDAFICVECWNNVPVPAIKKIVEVEEIRND